MNDTMTWKKIFSGQFIFTVVSSLVFFFGARTHFLTNEQVMAIIMLVVSFYFSKPKEATPNTTSTITETTKTIDPIKSDEVKV